jgi:hypothetical protein
MSTSNQGIAQARTSTSTQDRGGLVADDEDTENALLRIIRQGDGAWLADEYVRQVAADSTAERLLSGRLAGSKGHSVTRTALAFAACWPPGQRPTTGEIDRRNFK